MNIYEIAINLCKENLKKDINLIDKVNEISKSVSEFNSRLRYSKQLLLLEVRLNNVVVLYRGNPLGFDETENIKSINRFLSTLVMKYRWKDYLNTTGKKFFDVKIVKVHRTSNKEILNDSTIVNLKKYNSSSNINRFLMESDLNEINSKIIGCENFKKETQNLQSYVKLNKSLIKSGQKAKKDILPYHYLFKGNYGIDHYKMVKKLSRILFSINLIEIFQIYKIDAKIQNAYFWNSSFKNIIKKSKYGVVFIENITIDNGEVVFEEMIESVLAEMKKWRGKIVFILSYYDDEKDKSNYQKLFTILMSKINFRTIELPFYSYDELHKLVTMYIEKKNYQVDKKAIDIIVRYIKSVEFDKGTDLYYIIEKSIEKALFEKKLDYIENKKNLKYLNNLNIVKKKDLNFLNEELFYNEDEITKTMDELNTLIGLKEVKERVSDIYDFVKIKMRKRELNIPFNRICMHMEFTGNPGTGKTTIARNIGKLLKNLGYLSKGHFVEITRENLIGEYIGQTLPKVKKVINEALGGILFIDEAYNLYMNDKSDYGVEAISYLVKFMEDYKDDLIIIFAGYPKEMEEMIKINPGLKDRIAFKVVFADYTTKELTDIFMKFLKDNYYTISAAGKDEVYNFIKKAKESNLENFGNARFIRKIFERIELIQNKRICKDDIFDKNFIQKIIKEDILNLKYDPELIKIMNKKDNKKIGF
ncbi:MAG: AAA family ATPase [Clostridiales bacterium]